MEFSINTKSLSPKKIATVSFMNEKYPTDLSMYTEPPTEQIDIGELQEMAIERVKLLRVLETASLKSVKGMSLKEIVLDEMTKQGMKYFLPLIRGYADAETKRRDYLSHFVLRLCYCRSEDLRRWFIARELEFFRLKFFNLGKDEIFLFMKKNNLNYASIGDEEKKALATELYNSTGKSVNVASTVFYKVPFQQVLDLVRLRKIYIKAGNGYVPQADLISILSSLFRIQLSHALAICASNISKLESDERLSRILKGLHTSYTGNNYCVTSKDNISRSSLDALSKVSFPPCMRIIHETFKTTHHLKYHARLQFGLFLKGIGVSLEESLKFWKEGFTKKPDIDGDIFEKRYAYNIRHSYGTEGKRANYAPHNCMKIINTNVGPGDNHGCPFKHFDVNSLRQKLLSYNISLMDVSAITDFATRGHYQLACTKYFEVVHNVTNVTGINHPNFYFEESQKILSGKEGEKKPVKKPVEGVKREILKKDNEWNDSDFDLDLNALQEVENCN